MKNRKIKFMLIAALAMICFSASASQAQVALFNINTDDAFRVNTGAPYIVNGRTYYYTQTPVVVTHKYNDRRFCPPGQFKHGRCADWRYYEKHRRIYEEQHMHGGDHDWHH
jgi:hypothetical protein